MNESKELISQIAGIENWGEFEEFVKGLYAENEGTLHVERNYKANGKSGRVREVDVLVKFGFTPHTITLGVECKYWSQKVDGDIIDVAYAKKDDLKLDKFAVITTVGFEAGAELYAKNRGIDLFIIRPSEDDDFGYAGKVIKFKLRMEGSRPTNINFKAQVLAEQGRQAEAVTYVKSKLSNMAAVPENAAASDAEIDLYRYAVRKIFPGATYTKGTYVNNLAKLILETWKTQNDNFWCKRPYSFSKKIKFQEPTAMFLPNKIIVLVEEIDFTMHYLICESEFEVDRGVQYPLILENVIENAITPLSPSSSSSAKFKMRESEQKLKVKLAEKPADVVGREGVTISMRLNIPMTISGGDIKTKYYELIANEVGASSWVLMPQKG